jgi:hypothetical protein
MPQILSMTGYRSDLTPKGLAKLGQLPNLEYLNLHACPAIDGPALRSVARFPSLKALNLDGELLKAGKYTLQDIQFVQDARPMATIRMDENAEIPGLKPAAAPPSLAARLLSGEYEWTKPVNLGAPINTNHSEQLVNVSDEELELVLLSAGKLRFSRRKTRTEPFGNPKDLPGAEVLTSGKSVFLSLTGDGLLTTFYQRAENATSGDLIHVAQRANRDDPFGKPVALPKPVNETSTERHPTFSPDGLHLATTTPRYMSDQKSAEIVIFQRKSRNEPFVFVERLPEPVNTKLWDMPRWISNDRCVIVATAQETMKHTTRLWVRGKPDGEFQEVPLPAGLTDSLGVRVAFTPQGDRLYFSADGLAGSLGSSDIWMCELVKKK